MNWLRRLFARRCRHEWTNTGASYTDETYGFTIVLKQCVLCDVTVVTEV